MLRKNLPSTFVSLFIHSLNKMCRHKVLISNFHGYVARCESCSKVQIAFGTSLFGMSMKEFEVFANYLYHLRVKGDAYGLHEKRIRVSLGDSASLMILTPYELENFIEMIESASIKNLIQECLTNLN